MSRVPPACNLVKVSMHINQLKYKWKKVRRRRRKQRNEEENKVEARKKSKICVKCEKNSFLLSRYISEPLSAIRFDSIV